MFLPLLFSFVVTGFGYLYWKYYKASALLANITGPKSLPIVGNLLEVAKQGNAAESETTQLQTKHEF